MRYSKQYVRTSWGIEGVRQRENTKTTSTAQQLTSKCTDQNNTAFIAIFRYHVFGLIFIFGLISVEGSGQTFILFFVGGKCYFFHPQRQRCANRKSHVNQKFIEDEGGAKLTSYTVVEDSCFI